MIGLLKAIQRGEHLINGFRNRDLQQLLYDGPASDQKEYRRRSAAISRKLSMLRAHGVIRKISHAHRYQVSPEARTMLVAILTPTPAFIKSTNSGRRRLEIVGLRSLRVG